VRIVIDISAADDRTPTSGWTAPCTESQTAGTSGGLTATSERMAPAIPGSEASDGE